MNTQKPPLTLLLLSKPEQALSARMTKVVRALSALRELRVKQKRRWKQRIDYHKMEQSSA
jgi:hypothetical protein